jgi:hypothetical protein
MGSNHSLSQRKTSGKKTEATMNVLGWVRSVGCGLAASALLAAIPSQAGADMVFGPTAYLSFADSPFVAVSGTLDYWYLEDFEDHALNTPGVTAAGTGTGGTTYLGTTKAFAPSFVDSVDGDDGSINGSGSAGDSFFHFDSSNSGIRFTFSAGVLGSLPTYAGIVWTDGSSFIQVEVYGPGNTLLHQFGPFADPPNSPDALFTGQTAEDRFFGMYASGGIESILVFQSGDGIEVDHLQYGGDVAEAVPEPTSLALLATGAIGLLFGRRLRKPRRENIAS